MQEFEITIDGSTGESFIACFHNITEAREYAEKVYGMTNWDMIRRPKKDRFQP